MVHRKTRARRWGLPGLCAALLLAAGALVFAVVNLRRLEKTRTKWLYMAGCAAWIGLLAVGFVRAQLWK